MSVLISDLVLYGCANMPEADGTTTGGAINFNNRVEFAGTSLSPTQSFSIVSSASADTGVKGTISYRDSSGIIHALTAQCNGTALVSMAATNVERLLSGVTTGGAIGSLSSPGGTTATGDIAMIGTTYTISGHTMQTGAANATASAPPIAQLQSGDGASVTAGQVLITTGGTGPNQIRRILAVNPGGVGADYVAVNRNWTTVPSNTTTYNIGYGFVFELAASAGGSTLSGGTSTQCTGITRLFIGATANATGGGNITFYDKVFVNNNSATAGTSTGIALTTASILIESVTPSVPGSDAIQIALANALNDTTTIANRQTAPGSATAFTSGSPPQSINVPSPGNLPASTGNGSPSGAQAVWISLLAVAGSAAWEGVPDIRTTGSST